MKICTKCKITKEISEFYICSGYENSRHPICIDCEKTVMRNYKRSKLGLATKIYGSQKQASKRRRHPKPTYSKEDLREWLYSQKKFHILFDNWVKSGHKQDYIPSVDRIDDNVGYTMGNIQLMTWAENDCKGSNDVKIGKRINTSMPQRKVCQYALSGELLGKFISVSEAKRKTDVPTGNISLACRGIRKHAGGFVWKYDN